MPHRRRQRTAVSRFPDGIVEYRLPLRRAIAAAIRRHRPDVVITSNFRETWASTVLNQADHIVVGRATIDACRDAGNRWVFADSDPPEPWNGVRQVWAKGSPQSTHAVDVTDTFDAGVASLRAHAAYLAGLGPDFPQPAEFLESMGRMAGTRLGCPLAVPFEVFDL